MLWCLFPSQANHPTLQHFYCLHFINEATETHRSKVAHRGKDVQIGSPTANWYVMGHKLKTTVTLLYLGAESTYIPQNWSITRSEMFLRNHLLWCSHLAGEGPKVSELGTKHQISLYHIVLRLRCISPTHHQEAIKGTNTVFGIIAIAVQMSLPLPRLLCLARLPPLPEPYCDFVPSRVLLFIKLDNVPMPGLTVGP